MSKENSFKLKILTPDKKLFEGEVVSLTVPTKAGEITVLKTIRHSSHF
jgi:F0F1-type ATP synthase epsilon subunit